MKRLLLASTFLLGLGCAPALAQVPCIGVGGVNSVPQVGVNCLQEPAVNSYAATGVGIVPASAATDVACITGKANLAIRLQYVRVSGSSGTLINVPVTLTKHASLNTLGTPATGTALPVPYALDSTDIAPGATTTAYTANPTINDAAPGIIDNDIVVMSTTGTAASGSAAIFDFTARNYVEAPTLRTAVQQLCVNFNATTVSTGLVNITFRWTESPQ